MLINAFAGSRLRARDKTVGVGALVLGGFLPDAALYVLTGVYFWQNRIGLNSAPAEMFGEPYDQQFFFNPWWVIPHNFFHAPLVLLALGIVGWWAWQRERRWGRWLFWLMIGCAIHTALDIPTHANDGPLLLFPFSWSLRYASPISYWDRNYFGALFGLFELALNVAIIAYFVVRWWMRRRARQSAVNT